MQNYYRKIFKFNGSAMLKEHFGYETNSLFFLNKKISLIHSMKVNKQYVIRIPTCL